MNHPLFNALMLCGGAIFLIMGGFVKDVDSHDVVGIGFIAIAVIHFYWMVSKADYHEIFGVIKD